MKARNKIGTHSFDVLLRRYWEYKTEEEYAKVRTAEAKDELVNHLVVEYGRGVHVLSKVWDMVCWVKKSVNEAAVRHVKSRTYDKLTIRPMTAAEKIIRNEGEA